MDPKLSLGPAFQRVEWPASASCKASLRGSCGPKAYTGHLFHEPAAEQGAAMGRFFATVQDIAAGACVSWTLQKVGAVHIALVRRSNGCALGKGTYRLFCARLDFEPFRECGWPYVDDETKHASERVGATTRVPTQAEVRGYESSAES